MKAMELRELSKSFHGPGPAGVTLEVRRAVYGFLGPNGAGKTTAIRVLMGLLKPGGGAAFLLGEPVRPGLSPALKRKIGYLPEEPAFPEALTGFEVLDFVRRVNGIPAEAGHARIDEVLDRFALSAAAHRRAAGYSRGMKQRRVTSCYRALSSTSR